MKLSIQSRSITLVALAASSLIWSACGTMSGSQRLSARGYLRFEVDPPTAAIDIDEEYSGLASGWVQETIPVSPGVRRVTVRAEGYLTQRFDIEVGAGEQVTLELHMERSLQLAPVESELRESFSSRIGRDR